MASGTRPPVVCRHRSADRPTERLESVINGSRVPIATIGTPALLFRRGLLPRGGLGEDRLGLVVEQVAAAGAADPVGLALVADLDRAAALGNDAERVRLARGEGDPLAGVADLAEPGKDRQRDPEVGADAGRAEGCDAPCC